jgi:hypothetical protein
VAASENEFDNILSFLSGNDAGNLIASNSPAPPDRSESEGDFSGLGLRGVGNSLPPRDEEEDDEDDDHDFFEDEEEHPMLEDYAEEEDEDVEEDDDDEV